MKIFRGVDRYLVARARVSFSDECRVFNGSLGILYRLRPEKEEAHVRIIRRSILWYATIISSWEDIVELAWCLTVHKVQGSRFDYCALSR